MNNFKPPELRFSKKQVRFLKRIMQQSDFMDSLVNVERKILIRCEAKGFTVYNDIDQFTLMNIRDKWIYFNKAKDEVLL